MWIPIILVAVVIFAIVAIWRWANNSPKMEFTASRFKLGLIVFILAGAGMWWFTNSHGLRNPQYVWEWQLPRGYYVRGLNKSRPMVAEVIPRSDGALWINTSYTEHGVPEVTRIRLTKVGDNFWEGYWEQDNPEDSGRCKLHKVAPDAWAGNMEGTAGVLAFCTLKRK